MTLTDIDIKGIQELLAEMDDLIKERGYPYALGCAQFWLKHIVKLSEAQKEGITQ